MHFIGGLRSNHPAKLIPSFTQFFRHIKACIEVPVPLILLIPKLAENEDWDRCLSLVPYPLLAKCKKMVININSQPMSSNAMPEIKYLICV